MGCSTSKATALGDVQLVGNGEGGGEGGEAPTKAAVAALRESPIRDFLLPEGSSTDPWKEHDVQTMRNDLIHFQPRCRSEA